MRKNLTRLFSPQSIAVVGAGPDRTKARGRLVANLDTSGFGGRIYPISRTHPEIQGRKAFRAVSELPESPDLALIMVPSAALVEAVTDCVDAGIKSLVAFSGLPQAGGDVIQQQLLSIVGHHGVDILGPNALGFFRPQAGIAATFAPLNASQFVRRGGKRITIIAQSGGTGLAWFEHCHAAGLNVTQVVMPGNEVDVDVTDIIEHEIEQSSTDLFLIFLEGVHEGPRFLRAAAAAADRDVPIVCMKVGSSESGIAAAMSHTGHIAGSDAAYDAAFDKVGIIRVRSSEEVVAVATAFATQPPMTSSRVVMVTSGGGTGGMAADLAESYGLNLSALGPGTQDSLREIIPAFGSPRNPVDVGSIVEDGGEIFCRALALCRDAPDVGAVIGAAHFGVDQMALRMDPSVRKYLSDTRGIVLHSPAIPTDENTMLLMERGLRVAGLVDIFQGLSALRRYARFQERWPGSERMVWLDADQTAQDLSTYRGLELFWDGMDLPRPQAILSATPEAAGLAAASLPGPVAIKIASPDIPHKTEVGGVALNITEQKDVVQAAQDMLQAVARSNPDARIEGLIVQQMAKPGLEMIVGTTRDPAFGHIIVVGFGGTYAEILRDASVALAPVSTDEASSMLRQLRGWPLLDGARGQTRYDTPALARLISRLSIVINSTASVEQVDLNPVILYAEGEGLAVVDTLVLTADRSR